MAKKNEKIKKQEGDDFELEKEIVLEEIENERRARQEAEREERLKRIRNIDRVHERDEI